MITTTPMSKEKMGRLPHVTKALDNQQSPKLEPDGTSVLSAKIFQPSGAEYDGYVSEVAYSRMGVIPLALPIPNPFLLTKTNVWQVALGLPQKFIRQIAKGDVVIRLGDDELLDAQKTTVPFGEGERAFYKIGGDALLYLLDKQLDKSNPKGIYARYRLAIAKRFIPKEYLKDLKEPEIISLVTEENTGVPLFDKFFFNYSILGLSKENLTDFVIASKGLNMRDHTGDSRYSIQNSVFGFGDVADITDFSTEDDEDYVMDDDDYVDERTLESLTDTFLQDLDDDDDEDGFDDSYYNDDDEDIRASNKKDSTETHQYDSLGIFRVITTEAGIVRLKNSILHFVPVIPVGFRKAFEGTADYKTVLYNRIVKKNLDIESTMGKLDVSVDSFAYDYSFLYDMVKLLFLGDDEMMRRLRFDAKKYKSINDELKSKHGLIRATMEGGRFDYTARTVIGTSPTMRIDTVGVPIEIVGTIFRPFLAKKFVADKIEGGEAEISEIDIPKFVEDKYKDYLKWIQRNGERLHLYAYIGRQPTLHYLSTQPFRVKPIEGQTLIISPLVVVPFNADCDGDQMHIEACLTSEAYHEIKTNTLLKQQPKRKPSGSIEAKPRLEIVYGLYLCYFGTSVLTTEVTNYTLEEVQRRLQNLNTISAGSFNEICMLALQKSIIGPSDTVNGVVAGHAALSGVLLNMQEGVDYNAIRNIMEKFKDWTYSELLTAVENKVDNMPSSMGTDGLLKLAYDNEVINIQDSFEGREVAPLIAKHLEGKRVSKKINAGGVTKAICKNFSENDLPQAMTNMVLLGDGVANRFPPRLTLDTPSILRDEIVKMVEDFDQRMFKRKDMVNLGLESLDAYDAAYSTEWSKLAKKIDETVARYLPVDNGFSLMANTGAKGDSGVLRQLFGVKGVIQQVLDRPFNCVIGTPYAHSLNGLEHFCTSYGAQKGLTDKVLATSKPGYLSRKLEHAGATQRIETHDCGTSEGIEMTILDINEMLVDANPSISWRFWDSDMYNNAKRDDRFKPIYSSAKNYMAKKILKRNVVITEDMYDDVLAECSETGTSLDIDTGNTYTTVYVKDMATAYNVVNGCWGRDFPKVTSESSKGSVKYRPVIMRSPITCKCPICQVCYGYDPSTDTDVPEIHKQVGFIAAQAISEPGTQMTMKNFQKGGVAGSANLTSSFDVICAYFDMQGRSKTSKILYDYVSPVAAVVKEKKNPDGTKNLVLMAIKDLAQATECVKNGLYENIAVLNNILAQKVISFPAGIQFKRVVQAGESVVLGQKYLDPKQLLSACGCTSVLKYLMLLMTDIYSESDVNSIYIETILSGMVLGKIMKDVTINYNGTPITYPAGCMISRYLLSKAEGNVSETVPVTWLPIGIKQLPKYKPDSMESVIMESMSSYLPKAALLQPVDVCMNPILRVAFNQGIYSKKDKEVRKRAK